MWHEIEELCKTCELDKFLDMNRMVTAISFSRDLRNAIVYVSGKGKYSREMVNIQYVEGEGFIFGPDVVNDEKAAEKFFLDFSRHHKSKLFNAKSIEDNSLNTELRFSYRAIEKMSPPSVQDVLVSGTPILSATSDKGRIGYIFSYESKLYGVTACHTLRERRKVKFNQISIAVENSFVFNDRFDSCVFEINENLINDGSIGIDLGSFMLDGFYDVFGDTYNKVITKFNGKGVSSVGRWEEIGIKIYSKRHKGAGCYRKCRPCLIIHQNQAQVGSYNVRDGDSGGGWFLEGRDGSKIGFGLHVDDFKYLQDSEGQKNTINVAFATPLGLIIKHFEEYLRQTGVITSQSSEKNSDSKSP